MFNICFKQYTFFKFARMSIESRYNNCSVIKDNHDSRLKNKKDHLGRFKKRPYRKLQLPMTHREYNTRNKISWLNGRSSLNRFIR